MRGHPREWRRGLDGGDGAYFASAGEDVHAVGSLARSSRATSAIVIRPDGERYLSHAEPDPVAE